MPDEPIIKGRSIGELIYFTAYEPKQVGLVMFDADINMNEMNYEDQEWLPFVLSTP